MRQKVIIFPDSDFSLLYTTKCIIESKAIKLIKTDVLIYVK
jgi:hypothetical protein